MVRTTIKAALIVLVLGLVAAACGGDDSSGSSPGSAAFNDADVLFAQGMIPHHEQAIEIAESALDPASGASATVRELASKIKQAQDPEIAQMTQLLKAWGKPTSMDMSNGHDMSSMQGMMSESQMASLRAARNAAFDQVWMTTMIAHHQGAVVMAKQVQKDGKNADLRTLAGSIITAQEAEIAQMRSAMGK